MDRSLDASQSGAPYTAMAGTSGRSPSWLSSVAKPRKRKGSVISFDNVVETVAPLGPLEEHRFASSGEEGVHLILRLPGRDAQLAPLLVGAHDDGPLHSPGADDNASGVAALLELARRWAADPPRRPIWLVAFDQEEWGMVGSAALAQELREAGQRLKWMVSLELLAFTSEEQR